MRARLSRGWLLRRKQFRVTARLFVATIIGLRAAYLTETAAASAPREKFTRLRFRDAAKIYVPQVRAGVVDGRHVRVSQKEFLISNNIRNVDTPTCLAVRLPREDSAWRTFFRGNSANSSRGSEYSELMVNTGTEIAHVDTPLTRLICINANEKWKRDARWSPDLTVC